MSETHTAVMSTTPPPSTPNRAPAQGHLYVRATSGPGEVHFLFEQQEKRLGNALGASVISHGALVLIILLIIRLAPQPAVTPCSWTGCLARLCGWPSRAPAVAVAVAAISRRNQSRKRNCPA